jgi:ornithine cyclodeaminase/alanine dehydrogenase-like protein (mu-crystallin family)
MHILDHSATEAALPWSGMLEALGEVLLAQSRGTTQCPVRTRVDLAGEPKGLLLTMPAADEQLAVVKTVTVHLGNRKPTDPLTSLTKPGLPAVQAAVLVMDAGTGERLAMLDGEVVTLRRTAALSALAVKLARLHQKGTDGPLHIIGSGAQARAHLQAFAALLDPDSCTIQTRNMRSGEQLVALAQSLGVQARLDGSTQAVSQASVIVAATSSSTPVLHAPIRSDAVICAIGAFTSTMAEVQAQLVQSCRIIVDTLEGCKAEAGDLLQAQVHWEDILPLHEVLANTQTPGAVASYMPRPHQAWLFKSVGSALWDLAAAHCWARTQGILSH